MEDALKIDEVSAKAGRLIRVYNKMKKAAAKRSYYSVWVEDADGSNERCLLFTEKELERAEDRARKNPEDLPKKGFLTDLMD